MIKNFIIPGVELTSKPRIEHVNLNELSPEDFLQSLEWDDARNIHDFLYLISLIQAEVAPTRLGVIAKGKSVKPFENQSEEYSKLDLFVFNSEEAYTSRRIQVEYHVKTMFDDFLLSEDINFWIDEGYAYREFRIIEPEKGLPLAVSIAGQADNSLEKEIAELRDGDEYFSNLTPLIPS